MSTSTRRLAAIMFTDIAGYTAMMQTDEARAIAIRQRHREVFERQHATHRGQIVQYYGDGTLSVFDSAVDAVACAVAMQKEFHEEPQVPLRIGLHTGDILISETEVIGDGVNLASRVESLAVPGAVLVSETVYDQVKNQPEFDGTSLGIFTFKNVTKPIEVFAISSEGLEVPNPKKLTGKYLKRTSSEPNWLQRMPTWAKYVAGFALFLLLAPIIYAPLTGLFEADAAGRTIEFTDASGNTVTREIMPESMRKKIYLGTFEVDPQDTALAWASIGLPFALEFDFDQDPYCYTSFDEQLALTSLSEQLQQADQSRCTYLVRGTVSQTESGVQADVSLYTVPAGQMITSFTQTGATLLTLGDSITLRLKQAIELPAKHLASFPDLPLTETFTRSPEAYKTYIQGLQSLYSGQIAFFQYFPKAVEIDSTFAWASYAYAGVLHIFQRSQAQKDRYIKLAMQHMGRMPDLYSVRIRQLNYKIKGRDDKALELLALMTQLEPENDNHWQKLMQEAYQQGKYAQALAATEQYEQIREADPASKTLQAKCLLWLERPEEGLVIIDDVLQTQPEDQAALLVKGQLLLANGDVGTARQVFTRGSLLTDQPENFERMLAHCDYVDQQGPLTEAAAQPYVNTYRLDQLTAYEFEIGYEVNHLIFRTKSIGSLLLYQTDDSTFGAVLPIQLIAQKNDQGRLTSVKVKENASTVTATPLKTEVARLFEAFREGNWKQADSVISLAQAAAPDDRFISLMAQHLEFRQTPAYEQEQAKYARHVGRYQMRQGTVQLKVEEDVLSIGREVANYGIDPQRLYPFKPGYFFRIEVVQEYVEFPTGGAKTPEIIFYDITDEEVYRAKRLEE